MTVACPRHGVVAAAKDTPCPDCQVALYDLGDRNARDVVRANRHEALRTRRLVIGVVFVVGLTVAGIARLSGNGGISVDFVMVFAGALLAAFASAPLARTIERKPALRALDTFLVAHKI